MSNIQVNRYFVLTVLALALILLSMGIALGYWNDSGSDRIQTKTVEVPRSRVDTSTDACVKNGGVPTYSAWDGGLNGCIFVGQTSRDTNVELKR